MEVDAKPHQMIYRWIRREFRWPLLLAIPAVALLIALLSSRDFLEWDSRSTLKPVLEIIHPGLLFGFTVIALVGWLGKGYHVSAWMALLGSAFLMREIHFAGSDYLMGIIVLGIAVYVWRHPSKFEALWATPWSLSLLVMSLVSYGCSEVLFDRGLIKQPFEIIFSDPEWKLPYSSNIEESLETLGGFFLLLSGVIFTFRAVPGKEGREER